MQENEKRLEESSQYTLFYRQRKLIKGQYIASPSAKTASLTNPSLSNVLQIGTLLIPK